MTVFIWEINGCVNNVSCTIFQWVVSMCCCDEGAVFVCVFVTAAGCVSVLTVPPSQTHIISPHQFITSKMMQMQNIFEHCWQDYFLYAMFSMQIFEWIILNFSIWLPILFEIIFHIFLWEIKWPCGTVRLNLKVRDKEIHRHFFLSIAAGDWEYLSLCYFLQNNWTACVTSWVSARRRFQMHCLQSDGGIIGYHPSRKSLFITKGKTPWEKRWWGGPHRSETNRLLALKSEAKETKLNSDSDPLCRDAAFTLKAFTGIKGAVTIFWETLLKVYRTEHHNKLVGHPQ